MDQFMVGFISRLILVSFLGIIAFIWWQSYKGHKQHKQQCRDYEQQRSR